MPVAAEASPAEAVATVPEKASSPTAAVDSPLETVAQVPEKLNSALAVVDCPAEVVAIVPVMSGGPPPAALGVALIGRLEIANPSIKFLRRRFRRRAGAGKA